MYKAILLQRICKRAQWKLAFKLPSAAILLQKYNKKYRISEYLDIIFFPRRKNIISSLFITLSCHPLSFHVPRRSPPQTWHRFVATRRCVLPRCASRPSGFWRQNETGTTVKLRRFRRAFLSPHRDHSYAFCVLSNRTLPAPRLGKLLPWMSSCNLP